VLTSDQEYHCKNVVVATGFYDKINPLKVPGENLSKVYHYYREPHPFFSQNVAVIGGANSAVDAALEVWRKGAKSVVMIIREKEISERVKYWVKPDILNRIKEGSIKAYFEAEVLEIDQKHIHFLHQDKKQVIENDAVLALTGYQPNFELLDKAGVAFGPKPAQAPVYNENTMETNVKGLYLAGVVCGGLETHKWFIENSRIHAELIVKHIAGKKAAGAFQTIRK
jgi:thioredoxin reductase (NADPH)